jgi:predicted ATPase
MIFRGVVLAEQGQEYEGIAQIQQGIAAFRATGAELYRPYFLALLAAAHEKAAQGEQGLAVLVEALAAVDNTGEQFYEAELYRLKGALSLKSSQIKTSQGRPEATNTQPLALNLQTEAEAEACFLKAIEIARKQQAKSVELRAVMSLSRLWQQQGKKEEAHQLLADIYGCFSEGFDTKDLHEAKVLLDELAEGR